MIYSNVFGLTESEKIWPKGRKYERQKVTVIDQYSLYFRWYPAEEGELHCLWKTSKPVSAQLCVWASCAQSTYLQGMNSEVLKRCSSLSVLDILVITVLLPPLVMLQVLHEWWHQQRLWWDGWAVQVRYCTQRPTEHYGSFVERQNIHHLTIHLGILALKASQKNMTLLWFNMVVFAWHWVHNTACYFVSVVVVFKVYDVYN